jgi:hypothetical protein
MCVWVCRRILSSLRCWGDSMDPHRSIGQHPIVVPLLWSGSQSGYPTRSWNGTTVVCVVYVLCAADGRGWTGKTPHDWVVDGYTDESRARAAQCRTHLLRVEASLVYPWWPNILHSLFSDHLKKTIATFRVGTWYLAHMTEYVDPLHATRSLSWLVVSYVMPHIGLGWMAPRWLPVNHLEEDVEDADPCGLCVCVC